MGVGLSAQGVNMNRLPGWDKHSYGYHGDDGNSFCSSGTGQAYGPTFTTNDIIGKKRQDLSICWVGEIIGLSQGFCHLILHRLF